MSTIKGIAVPPSGKEYKTIFSIVFANGVNALSILSSIPISTSVVADVKVGVAIVAACANVSA